MIFVIDDDEIMAECVARAIGDEYEVRIFRDGMMAMGAIAEREMPEMIFLDVLLNGPDGFTFLNEMVSYVDTGAVPVVIVSSLDFSGRDLTMYGVKEVLRKETMTPGEIRKFVEKYGGRTGIMAGKNLWSDEENGG